MPGIFSLPLMIVGLLMHGREMLGDAEAAIAALSSGAGGLAKLEALAEALGHLATHTAAALGQKQQEVGVASVPVMTPAPIDRDPPEVVGEASNTGA